MSIRVLFGDHKPIFETILSYLDTSSYEAMMGNPAEEDLDSFEFTVPLTLADHAALTRLSADAPVRAIIPDRAAVQLCHDKLSFNQRMVEAGLGEYIPQVIPDKDAKPPFILKRREDHFGFNSKVIRTDQEYDAAIERVQSEQYFKQTYIDGETEYGTHVLMRNGHVAYQKTVKYEMNPGDYVKGHLHSHRDVSWHDTASSIGIFTDMLRAAGFNDGTCCIDYKMVGEVPKVFEINPRFGGSLPYDINGYLTAYGRAL